MKTLNLYSPEFSEINYVVHKFPDGEIHLELIDIEVEHIIADEVEIIAPIRNANELFIFLQALDILRHVKKREIIIPYLMGARNDRRMNDRRPLSLDIVISTIFTQIQSADKIKFITIHNEEEVERFIHLSEIPENLIRNITFEYPLPDLVHSNDNLIILPDAGAHKRFHGRVYGDTIVAEKERDLDSGWITKYFLDLSQVDISLYKRIIVVDDLIDGGATFRLLKNSLKEYNKPIDLVITHSIQPDKLLETAELYDTVYVTDSFIRPHVKDNIIVFKKFQNE